MPYKQQQDIAHLHQILQDTLWGQVAYVDRSGFPQTVPAAVAHWEDHLIWHGSTGAGWLRALAPGGHVAVGIGTLEALVVGRSRLENSFWYRSAVIYGQARRLTGPSADAALDALTEHVLPGRLIETRRNSAKELAATSVMAIPLDDWVVKTSYAWPDDTPEDLATDVWAGVVPVLSSFGPPIPDPLLPDDLLPPKSITALAGRSTPSTAWHFGNQ